MGSRACIRLICKRLLIVLIGICVFHDALHGFPHTCINSISECLQSPSPPVMINGTPARYFTSGRGIKQGDPTFPCVIVMEYWSIQMKIAITSGRLQPTKREMPTPVSHLLFAYDMLIFCRASKHSFRTLVVGRTF